jgi:hypothetical protein
MNLGRSSLLRRQASEHIGFALALSDQLRTGLALGVDSAKRTIDARRVFAGSAAIHHSLTVRQPIWRLESRPLSPPPAPGAQSENDVLGVVGVKRKGELSA